MEFDALRVPTPLFSNPKQGFTLVELITVLTIAGILAVVAIPGWSGFVGRQHLSATGRMLYADLKLARSEAVTRARRVHICNSRDGSTCAAQAHWHEGWILFQDQNENRKRDADDALIRVRQGAPRDVLIRFGSLDPGGITFGPGGGGTFNGTFTLCSRHHGAPPRAIVFHASGRPRFTERQAGGGELNCD